MILTIAGKGTVTNLRFNTHTHRIEVEFDLGGVGQTIGGDRTGTLQLELSKEEAKSLVIGERLILDITLQAESAASK